MTKQRWQDTIDEVEALRQATLQAQKGPSPRAVIDALVALA